MDPEEAAGLPPGASDPYQRRKEHVGAKRTRADEVDHSRYRVVRPAVGGGRWEECGGEGGRPEKPFGGNTQERVACSVGESTTARPPALGYGRAGTLSARVTTVLASARSSLESGDVGSSPQVVKGSCIARLVSVCSAFITYVQSDRSTG